MRRDTSQIYNVSFVSCIVHDVSTLLAFYFAGMNRIWLGINDELSNNHWLSDSTGEPIIFENWFPTSPDNDDGFCAALILNSQQWGDYGCNWGGNTAPRVICEIVF